MEVICFLFFLIFGWKILAFFAVAIAYIIDDLITNHIIALFVFLLILLIIIIGGIIAKGYDF